MASKKLDLDAVFVVGVEWKPWFDFIRATPNHERNRLYSEVAKPYRLLVWFVFQVVYFADGGYTKEASQLIRYYNMEYKRVIG